MVLLVTSTPGVLASKPIACTQPPTKLVIVLPCITASR